jgi:hypothetical protein
MYSNIALIPWQRLHLTEPYAGTSIEQLCHDTLSQFGIGFVLCMYDEPSMEWPNMLRTASQQTRQHILLVVQPCEFLKNPFEGFTQGKITLFTQDNRLLAAILPVDFVKQAYGQIQNIADFLRLVKAHNLAVEGAPDVANLPK